MAVVVLVERHEEMRRLYDAWLRDQDHEVFNCPCIVGGAHGQFRCVLLADLPCAGQISSCMTPGQERSRPARRISRLSGPFARTTLAAGSSLPAGGSGCPRGSDN